MPGYPQPAPVSGYPQPGPVGAAGGYSPGGYPPSGPGAPWEPGTGGGHNRGKIVAGILAAVMLLCACVVGVGLYLERENNWVGLFGDDSADVRASSPIPTPTLTPLNCRAAPVDNDGTKQAGMPAFDKAPRTGLVEMHISTNLGDITIGMDRTKTPCTVASFEHLVARKYFDGTSCHRLVDNSMFILQCGDPIGDGTGHPGYQFADENLGYARYDRGVVAMANAGPNTNGSQFFILFRNSPLPQSYTTFGKVTKGLETVDRVAAGGHDNTWGENPGGGRPKTKLTFQSVTIQ